MSLEQEVRQAGTPRDAILLLARAIDKLATKPDPWDTWDEPLAIEVSDELQTQLAELNTQLAETSDPEEVQALQAKLRLLSDKIEPEKHTPDVEDEGDRVQVEEVGDAGDVIVDIPSASEEAKELRRKFATEKLNLGEELKSEDFIEAYVLGGPLWLYYGNRDLVMQYPDDWKRAMVQDVSEQSPQEAFELGRDILKETGAGGPEVTMEAILG